MSDVLDKIDASLEELEEQLLTEFKRLRDTVDPGGDGELDEGVKNALLEVTTNLHNELQNSGDPNKLELVTDRHEIMYSRVAVLAQLLKIYKFPLSYLVEAHEGVKERRRRLEMKVRAQRQAEGKTGQGIRGEFDHQPTEQRIARNQLEVTKEEELALEDDHLFWDAGIFSASRELAMLASLIRGGTLDRPPEEDRGEAKSRAVFEARDLSYKHPELAARPRPEPEEEKPAVPEKRDIAQTPEEIKRKLAARRNEAAAAGKASFVSKDIEPAVPQEFRRRPEAPKKEEPQRPSTGKATFVSKDIEPAAPQEFRRRPDPPQTDEPPASQPGKAQFVSKDIEPAFPSDPPRRREKSEEEKDEEEKKEDRRSGPAVFESRDLSNTPFKKD